MRGLIRGLCVGVLCLAFGADAYAQSAQRSFNDGMRAYRAENYTSARDHLRRACDLGHAEACYNYGVMAERGRYGEADPVHARWLYERACDGEHMPGCYNFGNMLAAGQGGEADEARARLVFETACTGGLPGGCSNLAILLNTGRGGARDQERARALFQQACDARDVAGCSSLGNMMVRGEGGATDLARGRTLLQNACNGGDNWSCQRIANLDAGGGQPTAPVNADTLRQGWAAFEAERYPEAMRLLGGHAQGGDQNAQYAMGYMYTFGLGVSRDYLRAADWLTRAAERGSPEAQTLIVQITPNIAQARFIDHIDRYGPDTSSLQAFSNDVYDYCALRGPNCNALLARQNRLERDHNMRAEAANMARIWGQYGVSAQNEQDFWARSRARSECLRRVMRSTEAQTRDRQQWRYVNTCS